MSGPTTYQAAPIRWPANTQNMIHDPNCRNPDCPYKGSKPAPPLPLVKVDPNPESKQLAELRLLIQANAEAISVLSLATTAPGPPGPSGPQGPPGVAGVVFKLSDATDEEVAAFALRLPPMTLQTIRAADNDPNGPILLKQIQDAKPGDVIQETVGYLGGDPLKIRLMPVHVEGTENAR